MSMNSSVDHACMSPTMMRSPVISGFDCDAGQHCGSADAGSASSYAQASLGLPDVPSEGRKPGTPGAAGHDVPSAAIPSTVRRD